MRVASGEAHALCFLCPFFVCVVDVAPVHVLNTYHHTICFEKKCAEFFGDFFDYAVMGFWHNALLREYREFGASLVYSCCLFRPTVSMEIEIWLFDGKMIFFRGSFISLSIDLCAGRVNEILSDTYKVDAEHPFERMTTLCQINCRPIWWMRLFDLFYLLFQWIFWSRLHTCTKQYDGLLLSQ